MKRREVGAARRDWLVSEQAPPARSPGHAAGASLPWVAVGLITLLAAALRWHRLCDFSLWNDEMGSLRDCMTFGGDFWKYPLGYLLVRPGVMMFGQTELGGRFIPVLVGIVSVPVFYLFAREMVGTAGALWATLFLALSTFHLYHSQNARYYSTVFLLSVLLMGCLYRGIERGRRVWILVAILVIVIGFWTHWGMAALVPGVVCCAIMAALAAARPARGTPRSLAIVLGPVVVLVLCAVPLAIYFHGFWGFGRFNPRMLVLFGAKMADRIDVALLAIAAAAMAQLLLERDPRGIFLFSLSIVPLGVIAAMVSVSHGGSRFGLVALPPFLAAAGWGCASLLQAAGRRRVLGAAAAVAVILSLGSKDYLYFAYENGQRPRWRDAGTFVKEHAGPRDFVIATLPDLVQLYSGRRAFELGRHQGPRALDWYRGQPRTTWFVVGYVEINAPTPAQKQWLNRRCELVAEFPLTVRVLDYTIRVYRVRKGPP